MTKTIRKCRLADSSHRNIDLRYYEDVIIDTINKTVPGKHPSVHKDCFLTDKLTQSEAVALGRALAKIDELKVYGKEVKIFRLFDGRTCEVEEKNDKKKTKGGRMI